MKLTWLNSNWLPLALIKILPNLGLAAPYPSLGLLGSWPLRSCPLPSLRAFRPSNEWLRL